MYHARSCSPSLRSHIDRGKIHHGVGRISRRVWHSQYCSHMSVTIFCCTRTSLQPETARTVRLSRHRLPVADLTTVIALCVFSFLFWRRKSPPVNYEIVHACLCACMCICTSVPCACMRVSVCVGVGVGWGGGLRAWVRACCAVKCYLDWLKTKAYADQ